MEIADTLQTKKPLCIAYTRHRLTQKISWHSQGAGKKKYGGGMNMTMEELTTLLNAWPRSSNSPDEVILLDYCLTPSMAIVFTTNRFLETARLVYAEQQQVGIPPWCWLDGTGRVIWQRTRVLLLGGLTANHTSALYAFSLAEKEKKESLQFTINNQKCH